MLVSVPNDFNPRSYTRSDFLQDFLLLFFYIFNPRSLHEERHLNAYLSALIMIFQSTLLHEERHLNAYLSALIMIFQSTLLTRGATSECILECIDNDISIHAPTRGATFVWGIRLLYLRDFNPRSYTRSDI